jgi:hypothetical protein
MSEEGGEKKPNPNGSCLCGLANAVVKVFISIGFSRAYLFQGKPTS